MLHLGIPDAAPRASLQELVAWCDVIVIGSTNGAAYYEARRVLEWHGDRPVVFLDGWDDPYVKDIARHVDVYFKREVPLTKRLQTPLPLQRLYFRWRAPQFTGPLRTPIAIATAETPGIVPLPFGVIDHGHRAVDDKSYDVAFMGLPTSRERIRLRRGLEQLEREGVSVFAPKERLSWWDYLDVLGRSRIGISLRGHGFDTYRYWEIPALGTLLLSETPRIVIPHNFRHAVEAWFAPPGQMVAAVQEALSHDVKRIAAAGHRKLLSHHTSIARAQTVLDHALPRMRR